MKEPHHLKKEAENQKNLTYVNGFTCKELHGPKAHPHQGGCQVSTVSAINTKKADIINVVQIPVFSLGKKNPHIL